MPRLKRRRLTRRPTPGNGKILIPQRMRRCGAVSWIAVTVEQSHLLNDERPWQHEDNCDELQAAWSQQRSELLRAWIARHPGSRPNGWWAFDATERRPLLEDVAEPIAAHGEIGKGRNRGDNVTSNGRGTSRRYLLGRLKRDRWHSDGQYESERDYLQRLQLVDEDELSRHDRLAERYSQRQADLLTLDCRTWVERKRRESGDPTIGLGARFASRRAV